MYGVNLSLEKNPKKRGQLMSDWNNNQLNNFGKSPRKALKTNFLIPRPKPALPPKPKNLPPARTTSTEKETVEERLPEEDDPEMLKLEEQIAEIRAAVLEKKRTIIEVCSLFFIRSTIAF